MRASLPRGAYESDLQEFVPPTCKYTRRGAHMIGRGRRTQPDPPSSKAEEREGGARRPMHRRCNAAVVAAAAASSAAAGCCWLLLAGWMLAMLMLPPLLPLPPLLRADGTKSIMYKDVKRNGSEISDGARMNGEKGGGCGGGGYTEGVGCRKSRERSKLFHRDGVTVVLLRANKV